LAGSDETEAEVQLVGGDSTAQQGGGQVDLLGGALNSPAKVASSPVQQSRGLVKPVAVWMEASSGASGLEITGTCVRKMGALYLDMTLTNKTATALSDVAVMFNKNSFKLKNAAGLGINGINPGAAQFVSLEMCTDEAQIGKTDPLNKVDVAIKTCAGVSYFDVKVPYHTLLDEDGRLDKSKYLTMWKDIGGEDITNLIGVSGNTNKDIMDRCENNNMFHIATLNRNDQHICYYSMKFINGIQVLVEITLEGGDRARVALKSDKPIIITCAKELVGDVLGASKPANDLLDLF